MPGDINYRKVGMHDATVGQSYAALVWPLVFFDAFEAHGDLKGHRYSGLNPAEIEQRCFGLSPDASKLLTGFSRQGAPVLQASIPVNF